MPRIAISYRRDDSAGITGRIFDRLVAHYGADSVVRDVDNIPLGVDFREHVHTVLAQTDVTLVVVGKRWFGPLPRRRRRIDDPADPVRVEVETALRNGMPIVPVLVEGGAMPNVDQLPDSLREFVYRNGLEIDSGRDFDQHIERLIRSMEPILARRAKELEQAARRVEQERQEGEEEKPRADAARQAEEERQRAEPARQAEEEKQRAEAARQAEEERQRTEATTQQAEEEKQRVEAARQAEENKRRVETARQAGEREVDRVPRFRRGWLGIAIGVSLVMTVIGGGYWLYTWVHQGTEEQQRAATAQKAAEKQQRAGAAQKAAEERQRATAEQVVRAFYTALGRADGTNASRLVIPEKRSKGAFAAPEISSFYSSLAKPLQLLQVTSLGVSIVDVKYQYTSPQGRPC